MSFFQKKEGVDEEHIDKLMKIFPRIPQCSVWSRVTPEDFTVKRFEAGFVNDICGCILTEEAIARLQPQKDDMTAVVVKMFPKQFFIKTNSVHRGSVHTCVSNSGLGPRLLFIDEDCCVNEYIVDSRMPEKDDDLDPEHTGEVIRMLARFHCQQVPVTDHFRTEWEPLIKKFTTEFPGAKEIQNGDLFKFLDDDPELFGYGKVFEDMDVENAFNYFFQSQKSLESPMVFAHMDFHRLNRVIKEIPNSETGKITKKIYFLDLDASMYAYRGFDLGVYFDNFHKTKALFGNDPFVDDDKIIPLIEVYRKECAKIKGEEYLVNEQNSTARILREVKVFALYTCYVTTFFALSIYCQAPKDPKKSGIIHDAYLRKIAYNALKKKFIQEGILPDVGIPFLN